MAIEKRKLSEVSLVETSADNVNILIEENGVIKRVSLESIKTAIIKSVLTAASNQDVAILAEAQAYAEDKVNAAIEAVTNQTTE